MPAAAQDQYYGEILTVAFPYCPVNTLEADGRLLPIQQYPALFSLLGTQYGGDGHTSFALPDLRGRSVIGAGQGRTTAPHDQGSTGGAETVTLDPSQVPVRLASVPGAPPLPTPVAGVAPGPLTLASPAQPIPIRNPYMALRYCVVAMGTWPRRP